MSSCPKEGWARGTDITDYSAPLFHSSAEIALLPLFLHLFPFLPFQMNLIFQKIYPSLKTNTNIVTYKAAISLCRQIPLCKCFHVFLLSPTVLISCEIVYFPGWTVVSQSPMGVVSIELGLTKTWQIRISFISQTRHGAKNNRWTMQYFWKRTHFGMWYKGKYL